MYERSSLLYLCSEDVNLFPPRHFGTIAIRASSFSSSLSDAARFALPMENRFSFELSDLETQEENDLLFPLRHLLSYAEIEAIPSLFSRMFMHQASLTHRFRCDLFLQTSLFFLKIWCGPPLFLSIAEPTVPPVEPETVSFFFSPLSHLRVPLADSFTGTDSPLFAFLVSLPGLSQ